jgi:hypothetical protein
MKIESRDLSPQKLKYHLLEATKLIWHDLPCHECGV